MNAQQLTAALGGRWHGASGEARCPAHEDNKPSFSIGDGDNGRLLTCCQAGCSPEAVWAALQDRGLVERAEGRPARRRRRRRTPRSRPIPEPSPNQDHALEIWRRAQPATGTLAEAYLRGRGIAIPVPPTIRFHPGLKHADTGQHLPALIAATCNVDRKITGIQRIFLTFDGRRAPVNRPKMALGPLSGSAVRLAPTTDRVWLTEGVEDALALIQMMGEPAWATLGTSNFKSIKLPENIRQVILAPDGDEAGQGVIQEAAIDLAGLGREVRAAKLPAGKDWCDVLDSFEERAGILEFEMELGRQEAEDLARREVIDG
jgi:hypothetical protein